MSLRDKFSASLKEAMRAHDVARTSTLRMILAKLKDADIAGRPKGVAAIPDDDIVPLLRGMVKSHRESVTLYEQGNRPELAAKELAEIAVIDSFLPQAMDDGALAAAVDAAIASSGAASPKDMGKVMAALKAAHGASLDLGRAGPLVRTRLAP